MSLTKTTFAMLSLTKTTFAVLSLTKTLLQCCLWQKPLLKCCLWQKQMSDNYWQLFSFITWHQFIFKLCGHQAREMKDSIMPGCVKFESLFRTEMLFPPYQCTFLVLENWKIQTVRQNNEKSIDGNLGIFLRSASPEHPELWVNQTWDHFCNQHCNDG